MGILSDFLMPALNIGGTVAGINSAVQNARETGQTGLNLAEQYGNRAVEQTRFQPFTVSTRTGSVQTGPTGNVTTALSPEQAAAQSQLFGQGTGMLTSLGNVDQRSQQLFDLLAGIRQPEIQRQRLGLEERLFNQGRSGVRTDLYGGTPEQLAQEMAIQEQMSRDAFTARGQAQAEQQQQFNMGSGLLAQSYLPEQQLLPFLNAGLTGADLAGTAARQGAQLQAYMGQSGLESLLGGESMANAIRLQEIKALSDLLGQPIKQSGLLSSIDSTVTDWLPDWLGGLFS